MITGIAIGIFISLVSLTSLTYAQVPRSWTEYNTPYRCAVFFSYPSDWIPSEEKSRNRFDTSDSSVVSVRSPSAMPIFNILDCAQWIGKPPLSFESYVDQEMTKLVENVGVELIERTHVIPDLVSNSSIDAYVFTLKSSIPVYSPIIKEFEEYEVGIESYWVLHNGIRYTFGYTDLADRFDSPESKQIRDGILRSLKFLY